MEIITYKIHYNDILFWEINNNEKETVPMFMFSFNIWSTILVNICASMYSLIRCTWYEVSHNKSNTSYMPMHSCKVKSCSPTKVISPHNLLFKREQSSDFEINIYHVKRGKYSQTKQWSPT